jgi:GDPmannose 4,6-dehydratase
MMKAFLTGVNGQDGSYLSEFLLEKGYEVYGMIRRSSTHNTERIDHLMDNPNFHLVYGDMTEGGRLMELINEIRPNEVYNLAAQSQVGVSFNDPAYTMNVNATGVIRLLNAIIHVDKTIKFYQASTSEIVGDTTIVPQNESTPFNPRSPYACAKLAAFYAIRNFRDAYNLFACNGILWNHESNRRSEDFVTRKITRAATRIKLGLQKKLILGNIDTKRDWGFSGDYIKAMWMMLQQDKPDDYVIATNETHSVREFLETTFAYLDLDYQDYVEIDPQLFRPAEVNILQGDYSKAKKILGWEPETTFTELVHLMVDSDLKLAEKEKNNA